MRGKMEVTDLKKQDEKYMRMALSEAMKAYALNETPIGAVLVRTHDYAGNVLEKPVVLARGYNRRNTDHSTLAHAEISCIKKGAKKLGDWRLEGCTMYVTLEPCPMCAGALLQSRIDRVVMGTMNPKAGACGSVLNVLENEKMNHQAVLETGILKEECSGILSEFFRKLRKERKEKG